VHAVVQVQTTPDEAISTAMVNISEGGLAVSSGGILKADQIVSVKFEIPSIEPQTFTAKAQVAWSSDIRTGMRFLFIDQECRSVFAAWLEMLACQEQSRRFNPDSSR
jgi:hypothetical protein